MGLPRVLSAPPGLAWLLLTHGRLLLQCESIAEEYEDELIEFLSHEADNVKDRLCSKRTGEPGWAILGRGLSCRQVVVAVPSALRWEELRVLPEFPTSFSPTEQLLSGSPVPGCTFPLPRAWAPLPAGAACSFFWMLCPARRALPGAEPGQLPRWLHRPLGRRAPRTANGRAPAPRHLPSRRAISSSQTPGSGHTATFVLPY